MAQLASPDHERWVFAAGSIVSSTCPTRSSDGRRQIQATGGMNWVFQFKLFTIQLTAQVQTSRYALIWEDAQQECVASCQPARTPAARAWEVQEEA
jgi:hypothetical protein